MRDVDGEPPLGEAHHEISGAPLLVGCGEVVASEEPDDDVVEEERPERDTRLGLRGRVCCQHTALREYGAIESRVRPERNLDHSIDATRSDSTDRGGDVGVIDHEHMSRARAPRAVDVAWRSYGGKNRRASPGGKGHRDAADGTSGSRDEDSATAHRTIGKDGPVRRYSGDSQARADLEARLVGQANGLSRGQGDRFRCRAERPVRLSAVAEHSLSDSRSGNAAPYRIDGSGTVAVRDDPRIGHW